MSQYLTPERLLALAGLPVTVYSVRKLTESVSAAPIYLRTGYMDDATIYVVTNCPPTVNAENIDEEVKKLLTPEELAKCEQMMYDGYEEALIGADTLDPTDPDDQEEIEMYDNITLPFAKYVKQVKKQLRTYQSSFDESAK